MNFKRYQARALETALPTALDLENYLIPMIVGEVGELIGASGKAHRDNWPPERIAKELAKEYGDIVWGVAVALHVVGAKEIKIRVEELGAGDSRAQLLYDAYRLFEHPFGKDEILQELWACLEAVCLEITTYTFEQVLEMNIAKLADRQARGVIGGSGNDR